MSILDLSTESVEFRHERLVTLLFRPDQPQRLRGGVFDFPQIFRHVHRRALIPRSTQSYSNVVNVVHQADANMCD